MPLKRKPETFRVFPQLLPLIEARWKEEKYRNRTQYFLGLILFDLYARRSHWLSLPIMEADPHTQCLIIGDIIADFEKGEFKPAGWFATRIEELIAERSGQVAQEGRRGGRILRPDPAPPIAPMKRHPETVRVFVDLLPLIKSRWKEERYSSCSDYYLGLILFDLYSRRRHWLTPRLLQEDEEIQSTILAEIVRDFDKGEMKPGGWFEHCLDELVEERRRLEQKKE